MECWLEDPPSLQSSSQCVCECGPESEVDLEIEVGCSSRSEKNTFMKTFKIQQAAGLVLHCKFRCDAQLGFDVLVHCSQM